MALFEAKDITKQFGSTIALDKLSLSIPGQTIYGLLGPNGAGKTTLIRIINQITGPDSGELLLEGRKLNLSDVEEIGYLPEERGLYKKMKVGEQSLYFARLKGLSRNEAMRRLKYWFKKLEMVEWWNMKIEELSKGMAQKVQFVITIIHEPKLIILDEPFTGFDPVNANIIKNEILFLREKGATILLSTHNMASVEELCDNITLIDHGKSMLEGRVDEIRKSWAGNEYSVTFEGNTQIPENGKFRILTTEKEDNRTIVKLKCLKETPTNDILTELMKSGTVTAFNPALPSMNDIFIRVVASKGIAVNNQF